MTGLVFFAAIVALAGVHAVALTGETSPVSLGLAGNYAILTQSGITNVPNSFITGSIGTSPIAHAAITGFGLILDTSGQFHTSPQVSGNVYASNHVEPTQTALLTACADMKSAHNDAAGRPVSSQQNLNILGGLIAGTTFESGVYNWGTDVNFPSDIYIKGSSTDQFIFQTTGNIIAGAHAKMTLVPDESGSLPLASNIVWVAAGYLAAGASSHLEGTFLIKTHAAFSAGSSTNGRILAQTAVTLIQNTITAPRNLVDQGSSE